MEDTASMKLAFKKRNVYNLMALIFLAISTAFGYLFFTQTEVSSIPQMANPNGPPTFNRMIYGGFGEDAIAKGMDVAVTDQFIYVSDAKNHNVQVFDLGGTPVFKFGEQGTGPGKFQFPYGICGDGKGNVFVADLYNGSVSVHDAKGKFIRWFGEKDPGEKTIESPGGLRIIDNKVYITDITKCKVYVFDLEGKKLMEIGKLGVKDGEFRAPNAVTADANGNIYVVDTGNQRVQVFDKTGKFIRIINGSKDGRGTGSLVNPRGIGIDSTGRIYVVSNLTHYIHGFDQNGQQLFIIGGNGSGNGQFSLPNGLFVTPSNEIYVTDTTNQRVAIFN